MVQEVEGGPSWFLLLIPDFDKLVHWGIFVVFTVLWLRTGTSTWRYAWVALGGLAVAAITELVQLLPAIGRDAYDGRRHHGPDRRRDRPGRRPMGRAPVAPGGILAASPIRGRDWQVAAAGADGPIRPGPRALASTMRGTT